MANIETGIERLIENPPRWMENKRLGLLINPASTDARFRHSRDLIATRFPGKLKAIFPPSTDF